MFASRIHQAPALQALQRRQRDVAVHAERQDQAEALSILRNEHHAVTDRVRRRARMVGLTVHEHLAAVVALQPDQESGDSAPPGPHEPCDAEDLRAPAREADALRGRAGELHTPHLQHRLGSRRGGALGERLVDRSTNHRGDDLVERRRSHRPRPHDSAVPQYGDLVGDPFHLGQPVADVADGDAVAGEPPDEIEDPFGVVRWQDRSRLVEDHGNGVAGQHLGHLDELSLGDRQPADRPVHAQRRRSDAFEERVDTGTMRPSIDEQPAARLDGQHHVVRDGEIVHERQLLIDDPDPRGERVARRGENLRGAVQLDVPLVRREAAAENRGERRLPGAVLADDRVYLSGAEGDRHVT
jgi:hypothetical protein